MNEHTHSKNGSREPAAHGMGDLLQYRQASLSRLWISLGITLLGMAVEIGGGLFTGSLALLSDAWHMFTHAFALGISGIAVRLAIRPPCHHRTFGMLRAEVLAAYTNALFLFGVIGYIAYEAVERLLNPVDILTFEMLAVAAVGLIVNGASILLLHGFRGNISIRSSVTHMFADTLSSVAIVIGAAVMAATGWRWVDPALSLGIAAVLLVWAWRLFRDTLRILMEAAPAHVNTDDVDTFVTAEFPHVQKLDRVRIWSITEDVTVFSAVVWIAKDLPPDQIPVERETLGRRLRERFGFAEIMLDVRMPEPEPSRG